MDEEPKLEERHERVAQDKEPKKVGTSSPVSQEEKEETVQDTPR